VRSKCLADGSVVSILFSDEFAFFTFILGLSYQENFLARSLALATCYMANKPGSNDFFLRAVQENNGCENRNGGAEIPL
jgi:hypothetical protein